MHEDFAERLMSKDRRSIQDPQKIVEELGVRPRMIVADLGCGPGFFTIPLAQKVGDEGKVYAVDSSPVMINHLAKNLKESSLSERSVRVVQADVSQTKIPEGSVDLVLFANILHDLTDRAGFLREVRRIAKHGARIIDIDWRKEPTDFGPPLEIRLSEEESREILTSNGFFVIGSISAGVHHYGIVSKIAD